MATQEIQETQIVRNIEETREWFLEHSSGFIQARREDGETQIVRTYPEALAFFQAQP
jgi:hypothetical protein